jgi:hypothetical protein
LAAANTETRTDRAGPQLASREPDVRWHQIAWGSIGCGRFAAIAEHGFIRRSSDVFDDARLFALRPLLFGRDYLRANQLAARG